MLAYAVPYAFVIGMHERAQQRFVVPLLPYLALLAAYGLKGFVTWAAGGKPTEQLVARMAGMLALFVPLAAAFSFAKVRSKPHTLGAAGNWIAAHVDPDTERVGIHPLYDVPLVRRFENQFEDGQWGGEPRKPILAGTPWNKYQRETIGPDWNGVRYWIEPMYWAAEVKYPEIMADPAAYYRSLGVDYVILPGEHPASFSPFTQLMRDTAIAIGTLVAKYPEGERMRVETKYEGLDTPHYTKFILSAPQLGPEIEIYRITPAEER
jgi:hypothetical protein